MKYLLAMVLCLAPSVCRAQSITVSGNQQLAAAVRQAAESLRAPLPMWNIVILDDAQWATWSKIRKLRSTTDAFSILGTDRTYLKEAAAISPKLRNILGHELGHLLTQSTNEEVAEQQGRFR